MKLGVGLPGYFGGAVEPATVVDWARGADQAGFHGVATHDRPDHDAWDPLATLAAAATVTERVRLATTAVLPSPPRRGEPSCAGRPARTAGTGGFVVELSESRGRRDRSEVPWSRGAGGLAAEDGGSPPGLTTRLGSIILC
jgi:hypothetical protein